LFLEQNKESLKEAQEEILKQRGALESLSGNV
jgi:hypothetical protein